MWKSKYSFNLSLLLACFLSSCFLACFVSFLLSIFLFANLQCWFIYRKEHHREVLVDAHEFIEVNQPVAIFVELRAKWWVIAGEPIDLQKNNKKKRARKEEWGMHHRLRRRKEPDEMINDFEEFNCEGGHYSARDRDYEKTESIILTCFPRALPQLTLSTQILCGQWTCSRCRQTFQTWCTKFGPVAAHERKKSINGVKAKDRAWVYNHSTF